MLYAAQNQGRVSCMRRLHIEGLGLVRDHLEVEAVLVSAEGLVVLLDDTR